MERTDVLAELTDALGGLDELHNFHGITKANIRSFLIEPRRIRVEPDDLQTAPRDMWAVLQQGLDGYIVAFDPLSRGWAVVERGSEDAFVQLVAGTSLAAALNGM